MVYIGSCVTNPFKSSYALDDVIDDSREITKQTFLKYADLSTCSFPYLIEGETLRSEMQKYKHDFTYHKSGNIYFFTHSAIEYFFKGEGFNYENKD